MDGSPRKSMGLSGGDSRGLRESRNGTRHWSLSLASSVTRDRFQHAARASALSAARPVSCASMPTVPQDVSGSGWNLSGSSLVSVRGELKFERLSPYWR